MSEENFSLEERIKSVPVHYEDKMYQYILSQNWRPPTMRVAGDEEGEDGNAMEMTTRIAGKWTVTVRKKVMAMVTRVVGEQWQQQHRGRWQQRR